MKQKTIKLIGVFLGLWIIVFIVTTQIFGIPLWWVFRGLTTMSIAPIETEFNILITPEAPTNIGDSVLVTILNASDQMPVEGAKLSLRKDGTHLFDYYTNIDGQTTIEYVGEVTIIAVSKSDFKTSIEAIPDAPEPWVRNMFISMLVSIVINVVGGLTVYMLTIKRDTNSDKRTRKSKNKSRKEDYVI